MTRSRPKPRPELLPRLTAALAAALATPVVTALVPGSNQAAHAAAVPPQWLPLSAQWCLESPQQVCIGLEVARTPQQQTMGLQQRPRLAPLRGMLFPYSSPTPARFWMHLTPEPLDMIFVSQQQVLMVVNGAQPCMRLPCRSYGPGLPVDGVIELAAGEAKRLGITMGTGVVITPLASPLPPARR